MVEKKLMESRRAFAESRGNALLVRKGNPKGIGGIADFMSGEESRGICRNYGLRSRV